MKKDESFNDSKQLDVDKPFSDENGFEQDLPKMNSGSLENLGKIDVRVIPGGISSKPGNVQIKPGLVFPGGKNAHVITVNEVKPHAGLSNVQITIKPVIHIVVFARYQKSEGEQLIKDIGYLNAATGEDFHLILAGYSQDMPAVSVHGALSAFKEINLLPGLTWFYDDNEFNEQVRMVAESSTWKYDGGFQLLICDVTTADGLPANIYQMFIEKNAGLENVILIDMKKVVDDGLFPDFDHLFEALRTIIYDLQLESDSTRSPTWQLSDRLGLKKGGEVTKRALAKAFKLEFFDAIDEAITLNSFAVKDIRKKLSSD
jgi:hypothetical protein